MPKVRIILIGAGVPVGTEVDVPEKSAAALVRDGWAEFVEETETKDAQEGLKTDENGQGDTNTLTDQETGQDGAAAQPQDEELTKVRKALDAKYKRDDLAAAAKDLGVEFKYNARMAEIIDAVIAAGKAEALLA